MEGKNIFLEQCLANSRYSVSISYHHQAFLVVLVLKNPPANAEMWVQSGKAIHASILAWRIPWTEEPGWLQSIGLQRVRQD